MKMIKIICGTYGFRSGNGILSPKTPRDPPFEVDDTEAKRLVALKVAEYADDFDDEGEGDFDPGELPYYDESMSLKKLREIAEAYGVENASKLKSKDAAIKAIEEAKNDAGV